MRKRVQITKQTVDRHCALVNNVNDSLNRFTNRGGKCVPSVDNSRDDLTEYIRRIRHILDEAIPDVDNSVNDLVPRVREEVNQNDDGSYDRSDS